MGKRGETTGYTSYSLEEIFNKKLEQLCTKIRGMIYSGTIYTTSIQYCCKACHCRIMVRGYERAYCLGCQREIIPFWSEATRRSIAQLMERYPTVEECKAELRPHKPPSKDATTEKVAYGARVEEARLALGLTREYLASRITKKTGGTISKATIQAIERGTQNPSLHIREQLEAILCMKEGIVV
jgi:ribosome-binding protein aMBF1 (putative translation factor)